MPTIAAFLQLLPAGFDGEPYRSTDGTVYCVVEGRGRSHGRRRRRSSGDRATFSSCRRGARVAHRAHEDAVLFSFSDRPVQKAIGLWREQAPAEIVGKSGQSNISS